MGEELKQVPSKHGAAEIAQIDDIVRRHRIAGGRDGRSTLIRHAVKTWLRMFQAGIVRLAEDECNGVPGDVYDVHQLNFDFPASDPPRKPLQRVTEPPRTLGRRIARLALNPANRSADVEAAAYSITSFPHRSIAA
ncbi:MAG TPA: hypothetical protein VKV15_25910 [Bryobacteraceae bacterium]|jgi:hypothetical protein|nr:hypothetical protein [Bryobacteraceae bacterium]